MDSIRKVYSQKSKRRRMTTREQLFLTPYEKMTLFHRFPCKLVLDTLLVILVSVQIVLFNVQDSGYYRATQRNWRYLFYPSDYDFSTPNWYVFTVDDTVAAVNRSVSNYYNINKVSLDYYAHIADATNASAIAPVTLTATVYTDLATLFNQRDAFDDATATTSYKLRHGGSLGPLDPSLGYAKQRAFLSSVQSMTLTFRLQSFGFGTLYRSCLDWRVVVRYNFVDRGQMILSLDDTIVDNCDGYLSWSTALTTRWMWLDMTILLLCVLQQILISRSIYRQAKLFFQLRKWSKNQPAASLRRPLLPSGALHTSSYSATDEGAQPRRSETAEILSDIRRKVTFTPSSRRTQWRELTISQKLSFFRWWFYLTSLANILNAVVAFLDLARTKSHNPTMLGRNLSIGSAAAIRWIVMIRYLSHNRNYYTLVLTLQRGVPRVFRFLLGVAPVFMAYTLFSVVMFGNTVPRFENLTEAMITLFAVLNGDVVRDTFMALLPHHPITGQIFMYTFVSLFIYVVLNVFIAIIEEAFFFTTQRSMQILNKQLDLEHELATELTQKRSDNDSTARTVRFAEDGPTQYGGSNTTASATATSTTASPNPATSPSEPSLASAAAASSTAKEAAPAAGTNTAGAAPASEAGTVPAAPLDSHFMASVLLPQRGEVDPLGAMLVHKDAEELRRIQSQPAAVRRTGGSSGVQ